MINRINGCVQFVVGQKPRFPAEFRLGSTLTDPTAVKFIYHRPGDDDPTVLVYGVDAEVVFSATGKYHVDLLLNIEGCWRWRWESSGVVDAAAQGYLDVVAENPVG